MDCSLTSLVSTWIIQHCLWLQYSTYLLTTQGKLPKFLPQKTKFPRMFTPKVPYRRYSPLGGSTATPLHLDTSNTHSFLLCLSDYMSCVLLLVVLTGISPSFALCIYFVLVPLDFVYCLWIPVRLRDGLRQFLFCFSSWENSLVPLWEED